LPFYAPSIVCRVSPSNRIFSELEKVSAATIVALSAWLLYMAAVRVTANWMAMVLTFIYALGTTSFSVSSNASQMEDGHPCQSNPRLSLHDQ